MSLPLLFLLSSASARQTQKEKSRDVANIELVDMNAYRGKNGYCGNRRVS